MKNFPTTFKIGAASIAIGAVLFMSGFFIPTDEQSTLRALTDNEIMEQAAGLGMVLPGTVSNSIQTQVNMPSDEIAEALTDEEIMQRAYELGMVFEDDDLEESGDHQAENDRASARIAIPVGANASDVARMLEDAGIIDNANAFSAYIMAQDMAGYINSGEYYIEEGLSHNAILRIISTMYRIISGS